MCGQLFVAQCIDVGQIFLYELRIVDKKNQKCPSGLFIGVALKIRIVNYYTIPMLGVIISLEMNQVVIPHNMSLREKQGRVNCLIL